MLRKEIHGFDSPREYTRFLRYLEGQVEVGAVREVEPQEEYSKGEIYGGRWFEDVASREVWRLVPPDFPFKGLWEPVDLGN
jgi:hypothetical protein